MSVGAGAVTPTPHAGLAIVRASLLTLPVLEAVAVDGDVVPPPAERRQARRGRRHMLG